MELNEYPMPTRGESGVLMGINSMATCRFCGLEVQWVEQRGARIPIDPDFSDHRSSCAGIRGDARQKIRQADHEQRVAQFLGKHGRS